MSASNQFRCNICIADHKLDDFLFFHCGHGYCAPCIESDKGSLCPTCRKPKTRTHRIFLGTTKDSEATGSSSSGDATGSSLLASLATIQRELNVYSEKVAGKMRDIVGESMREGESELGIEPGLANRLLDCADTIESMGPLLRELELERAEKSQLQAQVGVLQGKLKRRKDTLEKMKLDSDAELRKLSHAKKRLERDLFTERATQIRLRSAIQAGDATRRQQESHILELEELLEAKEKEVLSLVIMFLLC
ncbi:hypothetical protein C8J56DRAFT_970787 [Mycena floridula]|nr:hypothetical protein C8J56DRAFT_970787 [Mycena floridula]